MLYVRDDETGAVWGPTALPIRETGTPYAARHGQGYSRFDHNAHGVALELLQYVPIDDPIKISRLKITNHSGRVRRLSITAYVEWVLGGSRTVLVRSGISGAVELDRVPERRRPDAVIDGVADLLRWL